MTLLAMLLMLALAGVPAQAEANPVATSDILSVVPAEALGVLVLRDLQGFDDKLAPLRAKYGLALDLYPLLQAWLGIVDGLDPHGSVGLLVMPSEASTPIPQRLIILLPTTDRAALMTFWNSRPLGEGYFKVTVAGKESFLGTKGAFCVIGPDLDMIKAVVESNRPLSGQLSTHLGERLAVNDAGLWVNVAAVAESSLPDTYQPWVDSTFGADAGRLETYSDLYVGVRYVPEGLAAELYYQYAASAGITVAADTTESLLRGLVNERPAIVMGLVNDEAGHRLRRLGQLFPGAFAALGIIDPQRVPGFRKLYTAISPRIASVTVSISMLPEGADGLLGTTKIIRARGSARALLDEIDGIVSFLRGGPFILPRVNAVMKALVHRRAVETSGDVVVDHLTVEFQSDEPAEYASFKKAVGAEGLLVRMGIVDDQTVVITFGGGLRRFAQAVEAVRSDRAPLASDPGIVESAKQVAVDRSFEMFLSVDRFVALVNALTRAAGEPFRLQTTVKPGPPVAVTAHRVGRHATQWDLFIPIDVLTASLVPKPPTPDSSAPPTP